MLSWALAFFIIAVIAAVFGFTNPACNPTPADGQFASAPPAGWECPTGWFCKPTMAIEPPKDFICPQGWECIAPPPMINCGTSEIAKILFVVFVVLFLVALVTGLLRRP